MRRSASGMLNSVLSAIRLCLRKSGRSGLGIMRAARACSSLAVALASPLQRNRAGHRVPQLATGAFGLEMRRLQLKVPFGRAVGIVNQH